MQQLPPYQNTSGHKVHYRALALLLIPNICFGLGAEDTVFYGLLAGSKLVKLSLIDAPPKRFSGTWVYGSASHRRLHYCWQQRIQEVPSKLLCTSAQDPRPTVVYDVLRERGSSASNIVATEYPVIAKKARLSTGEKRGDGTLEVVYRCRKDCASDIPPRLYEVATYD